MALAGQFGHQRLGPSQALVVANNDAGALSRQQAHASRADAAAAARHKRKLPSEWAFVHSADSFMIQISWLTHQTWPRHAMPQIVLQTKKRDQHTVHLSNMTSSSDAGSLKRGVLLLRLLATAGPRGLPLTDLAAKSEIPHPSVHRLLRQLGAERLVEHNEENRRYRLGPLAFELGLAGSTMHDISDLCQPCMQGLAVFTEDTVYLVVRSGFDAVCIHRREGSFPIRTLVLDVGSRRPLGVGAGGLAILAAIAEDERRDIIERVSPNLKAFGNLTAETLEAACQQVQEAGTAVIQDRINLGVCAVGMPFRDAMGQPIGALSVAALTQRMSAKRIQSIADELRRACTQVEMQLRKQRSTGWQVGKAH
jgi:DNA-binding IclR family transcriptional regulator